jgi:predicted flap endonuclease-1-like 5' DNA nuclease/uncharacterized membrane protein YeaQ/YmgE (transglycosylase-associated protein family)
MVWRKLREVAATTNGETKGKRIMAQTENGFGCKEWCWVLAVIAGIIAAIILHHPVGWIFALILGAVVCLGAGWFLNRFFCSETISSGTAATTAAAAAATVAASASSSAASTSAAPAAPAPAPAAPAAAPAAAVMTAPAEPAKPAAAEKPAEKPAAKAAAAKPAAAKAAKPAAAKASTAKAPAAKAAKPAAAKAPSAKSAEAKAPAAAKATKPAAAKAAKPAAAAKAAPAPLPVVDDAAVAAAGAGKMPKGLKGPRNGKPDDLKTIEGIGPVLEKLCNEMGVYHFNQIAAWGPAEVAWMNGNLKGFKGRVSRDKWVAQARLIGEVGIEEFLIRAKTNNY